MKLIFTILLTIGCTVGTLMLVYFSVLLGFSLYSACRNYKYYGKRKRRRVR